MRVRERISRREAAFGGILVFDRMTNTKRNTHCPIRGCEAARPHADDPLLKELILECSSPERLTHWALTVMTELRESMCDDLRRKRIFAWHLRMRQPKELYVRTLYAVLLAGETELHHVLSGALPNSLAFFYPDVNRVIFENRGLLLSEQGGYDGTTFRPSDGVNESAHVSLRSLMTCIGAIHNPHRIPSPEKYRTHLASYCDSLDYMRRSFKAGKTKSDVLAGVIGLHKSAPLFTP